MNVTDMMNNQKKVLNGIYGLLHKNDTPIIRALLDEECGPNAFDDLEKYCDEMSRAADIAIELERLSKDAQLKSKPVSKSKPAPKPEPEEDDESFLD